MALFEHENECKCSYAICIVLAVIILTISIGILIISIELTNGKSQTNIDQKSNLLFLQRHDQSQKC